MFIHVPVLSVVHKLTRKRQKESREVALHDHNDRSKMFLINMVVGIRLKKFVFLFLYTLYFTFMIYNETFNIAYLAATYYIMQAINKAHG